MLVSALVLTLDASPPDRAGLLAQLAADSRLELGALQGHRLPVVAEVPDAGSGERLVEELQDLPGVAFVDVVLVDFSLSDSDNVAGATAEAHS
jgi:hypothetical protein